MLILLFLFIHLIYAYNNHSKFFMNNFNSNHKNSMNDVHNLMNQKKTYGYLSTINCSSKLKNYPHTSLVGLSIDNEGYPILCMSEISIHTQNIKRNNNISLLIQETNLVDQKGKRVTFTGNIYQILDYDEHYEIRDKYLEDHPEAFWLKYFDFNMYRIDDIKDIYYIGGFGKATRINVNRYLQNYK